jgi:hypothetical protein
MTKPKRQQPAVIRTHHNTILALGPENHLMHMSPDQLGGKGRPLHLNDVFGIGKLYILDGTQPKFLRIENGAVTRLVSKGGISQATSFSIHPEDGGKALAFRFGEVFLCATPSGSVAIDRPKARAWELFSIG